MQAADRCKHVQEQPAIKMYGSSGYFTQSQQRVAAPSKFPPTPQPGLQSSLMSQSFSQPSSYSQQLPPSNSGARPGSAGAQLMRKFGGGQASQPMSQLSDEQTFLASCQAPMRPRSAFAELGNSAKAGSSSQGASPRIGQKDVPAVVKDLLQEQERSRSLAASAQQKQLDSIEKRQDSILELISAQLGDRTDQSAQLGKLLNESCSVRSALQDLLQSFQLVATAASTKHTTTSDQACQTERLEPERARAATAHVHRQAASGYGLQSASASASRPLQLVNITVQQPAARPSQKQPQHVLSSPSWRQSKLVSQQKGVQLSTTPTGPSSQRKAPSSTAARAPVAHPGPPPASRSQNQQAARKQAAAPGSGSATKRAYVETFTSSPSTIFSYDDDATTSSHAQLTPGLPVEVDDEDLARAVRERMNRHRSKRMKARL
jgi:hypothetical protein